MLFNSFQFLVFFPVVVFVFFTLPPKFKKYWLLAASYFFYMCWNAKYALLLLTSTIVTYLSGIFIDKFKEDTSKKKAVVAMSFIINLGILFFFKYFNFAMDGIKNIFASIGIILNTPAIDVILPVGISFYTFQALSYTMDVYRGDVYAERDFITYALYVSFFPQLVAGPIERSKNLLKQLNLFLKFDIRRAVDGLMIMLWGYFLKIVLADRIAIFVDTVYRDMDTYGGMYLIVATALFAVQIYCDFAGYSTIAVGAAKVMGIDIMENFNVPYLAETTGDFWRRWHISLGAWMRDYVFYPFALLKGMQKFGKWCSNHFGKHFGRVIPAGIANILVFLIVGIWHGAELHYVLWGLYNGIIIAFSDILAPTFSKTADILHINVKSKAFHVFRIIRTFIIVNIGWYFDRIYNVKHCFSCLKNLFCNFSIGTFQTDITNIIGRFSEGMYIAAFSCILLFIYSLLKENNIDVYGTLKRTPFIIRWGIYVFVIIIFLISFMSVTVQQGFLYANF